MGEVMTADEYHMAHILVPLSEDAAAAEIAEAQAQAEDLIRQIAAGANFQSLAVSHSAG